MLSFLRALFDVGPASARERGWRLLEANLTPVQRDQHYRGAYFDVIGGSTGHRYRIHQGRSLNVDELDADSQVNRRWCFLPKGNLVTGDVMLAQKLALELFEGKALAIARCVCVVRGAGRAPISGFSYIWCQGSKL